MKSFKNWKIKPNLIKIKNSETGKIGVTTNLKGQSSVVLDFGANQTVDITSLVNQL